LRQSRPKGSNRGLIPRDSFNPRYPSGAVWFTRELGPPGWWPVELNTLWFYVEVVLPTSDSRLMSFERWLRENHPGYDRDALELLPEFRQSHWRDHYLYFGHVPPRRIKGCHGALRRGARELSR
jgi:predicted secreted hydrolase